MRSFRAVLIAAVVPLVGSAACLRVPPPPEDLAERHVAAPDSYAAAQPGPSAFAGVGPAAWVDSFGDERLSALVLEAWEHNPDLYVAAAQLEEAAASLRIVRSALFPQASAFGSVQRVEAGDIEGTTVDQDGDATTYALGVGARWELDLWGRIRADRSAAGNAAAATALDLLAARHSLAAATAEAYFAILAAQEQLAIDRQLLEAEQFTARITRQRVDAGLGTPLDADLADASVALAEAAVEDDELALREARRALELLLGRYPLAEVEATSAGLPPLPDGPRSTGVPSELLERRPDVRAAARRVDAAYYDAFAARAARLPTLTLSGNVATAIDPDDLVAELLGETIAPLFAGGRLQSQQAAANARQRQAIGRFASIALDAFREVESALSNEALLARRAERLAAASDRLRSASDAAAGRYEQGLLPILDLQQVRRTDYQTRSLLVSVRFEQLRQRLDLHLSLGGPVYDEADRSVLPAASKLLDDQFVDPDQAPLSGELSVGLRGGGNVETPAENRDE